jgi:hypothetical protein
MQGALAEAVIYGPEKECPRRAEAFWRHVFHMTPADTGRRSYDASKLKLSARDVLLLVIGCLGMFGAQLGAQWGMRSDIRDLNTNFTNAVREQNSMNASLQQQINDWRAYSKLAYEKAAEANDKTSRVEGILLGAGIIKERMK